MYFNTYSGSKTRTLGIAECILDLTEQTQDITTNTHDLTPCTMNFSTYPGLTSCNMDLLEINSVSFSSIFNCIPYIYIHIIYILHIWQYDIIFILATAK